MASSEFQNIIARAQEADERRQRQIDTQREAIDRLLAKINDAANILQAINPYDHGDDISAEIQRALKVLRG